MVSTRADAEASAAFSFADIMSSSSRRTMAFFANRDCFGTVNLETKTRDAIAGTGTARHKETPAE